MGRDVNWEQCVFVLFAFFCGYFFYFLLEWRGEAAGNLWFGDKDRKNTSFLFPNLCVHCVLCGLFFLRWGMRPRARIRNEE